MEDITRMVRFKDVGMKHGAKPVWARRSELDFHKSFGTTTDPTTLTTELNLDASLWMPDQEIGGTYAPVGLPAFTIPSMPYGCTDYAQTDLCIDEDGFLENPMLLEAITHANQNGGGSLVASLQAAEKIFARVGYYSIRNSSTLDWFDAFRICMASTAEEKRSISIGTPYFDEWAMTPRSGPQAGLLPTPASFSTIGLPWHNAVICGWKLINGTPYLLYKSWQGVTFGDNGWGYFSRALINQVMEINGTASYTLSKATPASEQTVDTPWVEWVVSLVLSLI